MPWELMMLLQNCMAAGLSVSSRKVATTYRGVPMLVQAIIVTMMYLFGLSFAILFHAPLPFDEVARYWPVIVLSGFAFVVSYGLTHVTYEYVDTAIGSLFSVLNIVAVVMFSTHILTEGLTPQQYVGAGILMVSIWIMLSTHVSKRMRGRWQHALGLAILAAFAYGVAVVAEKYLLDHVGMSTYLVFGWGSEWLWAIIFAAIFSARKLKLLRHPPFVKDSMVAGIFRTGTAFLFLLALVGANNSAVVAVWSGLRVLIAAILGVVILHERHFLKRKIEASVLALIAVGFLLW